VEQRRFVDLITVTGADDNIAPGDLLDLWRRHPALELGLLLSRNNTPGGCPRFPSLNWLSDLAVFLAQGLADFLAQGMPTRTVPLSGHLCGEWVEQVLMGHRPRGFDEVLATGIASFIGRWQLNTHGKPHLFSPSGLLGLCREEEWFRGRQVIFQLDGVNDGLAVSVFPTGRAAVLHDLSSGEGVVPPAWNRPVPRVRNGYAGGLGPDNVAAELVKIEALVPEGTRVWIDAETRLRSGKSSGRGSDSRLDLGLCRGFLEAAAPWTAERG
jgi:hypothetical protein